MFFIRVGRGSHIKACQTGGRIPKGRGRYETDFRFSHIEELTQDVIDTFN